ncbi:MAG: serine/threonine-protein phosphatase [Saprospiraceae bacterium]|nr:serine/threonine-protein phosphatase [Saprospiraceae bacterium]
MALHIAHIGDSRAYLIKDRQIYQLTEDHTYVRDLLKSGKINPLEAINHPQRNVLTQAMGTSPGRYGDIFLSEFTLNQNDTLLLCSDGLHEYFTNEEIKEIILARDFRDASSYLLEQAKTRGGHDNISLILVQESQEQIESASPTQIINP